MNHINEMVALKYLFITEQEIISKVMKLTSSARQIIDSGKIISMITVDSNSIYFLFIMGIYGINAPVSIIISLVLIVQQIGWLGLIGHVLFLVSLMLQNWLLAKNT